MLRLAHAFSASAAEGILQALLKSSDVLESTRQLAGTKGRSSTDLMQPIAIVFGLCRQVDTALPALAA